MENKMETMNDEIFEQRMKDADEGRVSPAFFMADCLEYIDFLKQKREELLHITHTLHSEYADLERKYKELLPQCSQEQQAKKTEPLFKDDDIVILSTSQLIEYVNTYNLKEADYYIGHIKDAARFPLDGSIMESILNDLPCTDFIDYVQIVSLNPGNRFENEDVVFVFGKKSYIDNIFKYNTPLRSEIIDELAKRVNARIKSYALKAEDKLDDNDIPLLELAEEAWPDVFYSTIETAVMDSVCEKLDIMTDDKYTWVALVDYVLDQVSNSNFDEYKNKFTLYKEKIEKIIDEREAKEK